MGRLTTPIAIFLIVFMFKSSDALKCWRCSSDITPSCMDYFNTTQFQYQYRQQATPQLYDCQQSENSFYPIGQKAVCMKKKMVYTTGNYEKTTYVRQCQFVNNDVATGKCPYETTTSNLRIDFCEYCDYDGCNGANSVQTSAVLSIFVPALLYFYLRK